MDEFEDSFGKRPDPKRLHHAIGLRKVSEGVFDDATLMTLYKLSRKGAFDRVTGIVSQGKEANVYHGEGKHGEVAIKIYCVDACDFKRMGDHIIGDPRFSVGKNRRHLVYQWVQREFRNLSEVYGKVTCPKPHAILNNVLVMEFIGENGFAAPKLKDIQLSDPEEYFKKILTNLKNMHSCNIVHGDLSEYNILDFGKPYFIDFSMGVTLAHPNADKLLSRDVGNICKFFSKKGVNLDETKILNEIKSS